MDAADDTSAGFNLDPADRWRPMTQASQLMVPLRTQRGMNDREHFQARAKRVRYEHEVVTWHLVKHANTYGRPAIPCSVVLTRIAPSNGLDDDNLAGALKGVRDAVAKFLGVDDRDRMTVRYRYAQRRGPWAVVIEFGAPVVGAQYVLEVGE